MSTTTSPSTLTDDQIGELADQYRVRSVQMSDRAGSGHPTSSMSAADLIAVLVARHLRIDVEQPDEPGNDRLLFSKGHASPLLYAALESIGLLADRLDGFDDVVDAYRQRGSILEGHPTPRIPMVPAATGALGLGLAIGVGLRTSQRLLNLSDAHVWVLLGDGELAEGAVWEAVEHAGSARLTGMTALVDVNRLGQTGPTRHGWDLDALRSRFAGFDWRVSTIDGHDISAIDGALTEARDADRPTVVLARTVKGRGVDETSDERGKHGKPLGDPDRAVEQLGGATADLSVRPRRPTSLGRRAGERRGEADMPAWSLGDEVSTRDAFGAALVALARVRQQIVALDGDVGDSTRLESFEEEFRERFVQAYIAEQLMAGAAIGLHRDGWIPVLATFGAFLTRAHDVLRMATLSRSDIVVVGSHAGVSIGADGPSQMGLEDIAMMRCLAGSSVVSPCDANQTAALLEQLVDREGISYLRTMRGATPVIYSPERRFPIGGSVTTRTCHDPDVAIVATGVTVHEAVAAAERLASGGTSVRVIDAYSIKPIDEEAIVAAGRESERLLVVEDHRPEGGLGDAVSAVLGRHGVPTRTVHLAVDHVAGSASPAEQRADAGIDADAIVAAAQGPEG